MELFTLKVWKTGLEDRRSKPREVTLYWVCSEREMAVGGIGRLKAWGGDNEWGWESVSCVVLSLACFFSSFTLISSLESFPHLPWPFPKHNIPTIWIVLMFVWDYLTEISFLAHSASVMLRALLKHKSSVSPLQCLCTYYLFHLESFLWISIWDLSFTSQPRCFSNPLPDHPIWCFCSPLKYNFFFHFQM